MWALLSFNDLKAKVRLKQFLATLALDLLLQDAPKMFESNFGLKFVERE